MYALQWNSSVSDSQFFWSLISGKCATLQNSKAIKWASRILAFLSTAPRTFSCWWKYEWRGNIQTNKKLPFSQTLTKVILPGPPDSVRCSLLSCHVVSRWASHWLATPARSEPPLHLASRAEGYSKTLFFLGWCRKLYTGSLAWMQKMSGSGSVSLITKIFIRVTLLDSWEFPSH